MDSQIPGEYFSVDRIVFGDLTGDGIEEAVVVTSESGGGSGQFSGASVFTLRNGRVVSLMSKDREGYGPSEGIKGGDRGRGGIHNVIIEGGLLLVEQYAPGDRPNAAPYQPAYIETTTYRWNGSLLIPNRNVARRRFSTALNQGGTPSPTTSTPVIGNIKNSNVVEGCSCSLSLRRNSNSYVFLSDYEKKNAWMNIHGRDVKLSFVNSTQVSRINRAERKGDRYTEKWVGRGIEVKIDYLVTAPMTTNKEYTDYATTITVTKTGGTHSIKAFGNCGC